ncbi:Crp/Fnr family transcriptional regulator [Dubosiella newyorkensis]|uniref:Crp/Fnr family transcriptional regulator n=1 Tax=Dubosiella newyorkensis TaxID=1862672 RepID=UPI0032B1AC54
MKSEKISQDLLEAFYKVGKLRCFDPGQTIYYQQDYGNTFYYIIKGRVRAYILNQNGKVVTLDVIGEDKIFGASDLFLGGLHTSNIEAVNDVKILEFDLEQLLPYLSKSPQSYLQIIAFLSESLKAISNQIRRLSLLDAQAKIVDFLLEKTASPHPSLDITNSQIPYSHEDIAQSCSLQRVTVSKKLKEMERFGWIELGYRSIKIKDRKALEKYVRSHL